MQESRIPLTMDVLAEVMVRVPPPIVGVRDCPFALLQGPPPDIPPKDAAATIKSAGGQKSVIIMRAFEQCPGRRMSHHRVPGALALVALWATAERSVCCDPSERTMIVWTFFGSGECDAGTDGTRRAVGSEEINAVFGGS